MAFLIRPPGQVKKAKAKLKPKSKNAQEILNRLQGFLNQNTSEPVEILCSFWEDQRNAITYKELREVVQSGMLTQKQFEDWQQDYSVLVEKKMAGVWMSAMAAGVAGQPMFDSLSFSINTQDPGIVSWIDQTFRRGCYSVSNDAGKNYSWGRCKVHDLFYHIPGGRKNPQGTGNQGNIMVRNLPGESEKKLSICIIVG